MAQPTRTEFDPRGVSELRVAGEVLVALAVLDEALCRQITCKGRAAPSGVLLQEAETELHSTTRYAGVGGWGRRPASFGRGSSKAGGRGDAKQSIRRREGMPWSAAIRY